MRKNISLLVFGIFLSFFSSAQLKIQNLLTENLVNPLGLDVPQPRFSWQLVSDKRNVIQTAYEIKVTAGKATVWSSGKIPGDQSVHVAYAVIRNNPSELEPVKNAKDQFSVGDGSTTIFSRDGQGKVTRVKIDALGMTFEGVKE